MLKLKHIFLINFTIAFTLTFVLLVIFEYKNQTKLQNQKIQYLSALIEELLDNNNNIELIKNLAIKQGVGIKIDNKSTNKTIIKYLPERNKLSTSQKLILRNKTYLVEIYTNDEDKILINMVPLFVIGVVVILVLSIIFNQNIDKNIKNIKDYINKISNKEYSYEPKESKIFEFKSIIELISNMKNQIIKDNKKRLKQNAKIHLKNTQLEGILSSIAHEFKNPISIIKISSQTLKQDNEIDNNFKNKIIDKIVSNSQRLVNLLDKIKLSFKDDFILNLTDINLLQIANEVANELMDKFENRKIIVGLNNKTICADYDLIKLVLLNLCENALKYSQDNIKIEICNNGIFVVDFGIGISEENLKLVTKKFFRVDVNSHQNSLGLGLYIVKHILKLHNFNFIIKSQLGKGSIIGFEF